MVCWEDRRELPGFSLAPREPPSQGAGKLLDGCFCLREGSRALKANIVNNINLCFMLVLSLYILYKIRGSMFSGIRRFDVHVAQ